MSKRIFYIGGSPCSGKSTMTQRIAEDTGAYYYKADDDLDRFVAMAAEKGGEASARCLAMTPDETWMRDPSVQCEAEFRIYDEIAEFVFAALDGIEAEYVIAEGAAFTPSVMARYGIRDYIAIVPEPDFQVSRYREREWVRFVLEGCSDKEAAFDNWMRRDMLFARGVAEACEKSGIPVIVNDGTMSVDDMYRQVIALLGLAPVTIETDRLILSPAGNIALMERIAAESDPALREAYGEMLEGCLKHPARRVWHAPWFMALKDDPASIVGDLGFKGLNDGTVEIGYGLKEGFCHRGYMTEAVLAVSRWAVSQPGVSRVEAEAERDNFASQRVLLRAGYLPTGVTGREGPRFVYTGSPRNIRLVRLTPAYRRHLTDMLEEWTKDIEENHTNHSPWVIFRNDYRDFDYYLENLEFKEESPEGRVPDTTLFCLDRDRDIFVGAVNIRHYLNEGLLRTGGHIGDGIRPSERRKGYATAMVALALEECKRLGIDRVLMCCDEDNEGSRKSIVRNGGILENKVWEEDCYEERYWIRL